MSVKPLGLLPSVLNKLTGSLVRGTPTEARERAIKSFSAWCLAVLPGALLQLLLSSSSSSLHYYYYALRGYFYVFLKKLVNNLAGRRGGT